MCGAVITPTVAGRRRVAMQLSSQPGPRAGGPGSFVEGLLAALRRNPNVDAILVAPEATLGGPHQRLSQLRLLIQQFWQLWRLRPDVIHSHGHPALLAAALAYRAVSGRSARVIFTAHIDPVDRGTRWTRWALGRLLSYCASITVFSRSSVPKLSLIAEPVPRLEATHVIRAAAAVRVRKKDDPDVIRFGAQIGYRGGPLLLQVSNFNFPAKVAGALLLLDAFVIVRERFPSAQLLIVGTGELVGSVLEKREQLGLADAVIVPGTFIEDLSPALALSDIHCHISRQDACPISIIEAMHAAKPIVASRNGGIPEMFEDGTSGLLVDDDPVRIAGAIFRLLEDPAGAMELGRQAQQRASVRFSWESIAADFERLYGVSPL